MASALLAQPPMSSTTTLTRSLAALALVCAAPACATDDDARGATDGHADSAELEDLTGIWKGVGNEPVDFGHAVIHRPDVEGATKRSGQFDVAEIVGRDPERGDILQHTRGRYEETLVDGESVLRMETDDGRIIVEGELYWTTEYPFLKSGSNFALTRPVWTCKPDCVVACVRMNVLEEVVGEGRDLFGGRVPLSLTRNERIEIKGNGDVYLAGQYKGVKIDTSRTTDETYEARFRLEGVADFALRVPTGAVRRGVLVRVAADGTERKAADIACDNDYPAASSAAEK